jgi:hypothetical protein
MRGHGIVCTVLVVVGSLCCPGCGREIRTSATGVEVEYEWNTLEARLDYGIEHVYKAARETAHELDLEVFRGAQDGIAAEILALDARRDEVEIVLGALPGSRTELCIRVGCFGDRNKSVVLFDAIMSKLTEEETAASVLPPVSGITPVGTATQDQ